jgi:hypothetical protein
MNPVGLSLEQAPPFDAPLRFFLTAPLFLVLAAMVLLWHGPDFFISRWLPAPLALTHLLTLGFMAQVMLGALLQMLPVVIGVTVPHPQWIAALIHLPLTLGTLTLAGAFLFGNPLGFQIASGLLGLGFGVALIAFNLAVWRAPVTSGMVIAVRCALGGLLVTVMLGLLLGGFFGWGLSLPVVAITTLHAVWGLIGWTVLLVAGIADQVVPMFHITPAYPRWLSRRFAPLMTAMLALWSGLILGNGETAAQLAGVGLALGIARFRRDNPASVKPAPPQNWRSGAGLLAHQPDQSVGERGAMAGGIIYSGTTAVVNRGMAARNFADRRLRGRGH